MQRCEIILKVFKVSIACSTLRKYYLANDVAYLKTKSAKVIEVKPNSLLAIERTSYAKLIANVLAA